MRMETRTRRHIFFHEHRGFLMSQEDLLNPSYYSIELAVEDELSRAIRDKVPTGWVFKDQARVGLHMLSIIERIRERKTRLG